MKFLDFELALDARRRVRIVDFLGELLKIRYAQDDLWMAVNRRLSEESPVARVRMKLERSQAGASEKLGSTNVTVCSIHRAGPKTAPHLPFQLGTA
jgi:hypothetical protein